MGHGPMVGPDSSAAQSADDLAPITTAIAFHERCTLSIAYRKRWRMIVMNRTPRVTVAAVPAASETIGQYLGRAHPRSSRDAWTEFGHMRSLTTSAPCSLSTERTHRARNPQMFGLKC